MGTAKRERQKMGRQERIQAAIEAEQRRKRTRTIRNAVILVVGVVVVLFVLSRFTGNDKSKSATTTASSTPTSTTKGVVLPPPGATVTGDTPCPPADGSAARTTTFAKPPPPMCIDPNKTYTATLHTSMGDVTMALDAKAAPTTVNNFVVLSRYHYYDGVAFHRVVTGFVDQTGDPNGPTPGQGGPGYTIPDELPADTSVYTEGAVAMANTGQPGSGGSQFFIVIGSGGQQLTASYTKFGTVTAGLDVAQKINQAGGPPPDGVPATVATIDSVTITES